MLEKNSILSFLDNADQNIGIPCLGNMNIDYVSHRLSVYRSTDEWILLFNSIAWWPSLTGLVTLVETVGTGAISQQDLDDKWIFEPGLIEQDEDVENVLSIVVRDENIDPASLVIQPHYDIQGEHGFWVCVALAEKFKDRLLASPDEIKPFIPSGFQHLLTIDEWEHSDWDKLPSQTETFPRIADVLIASDPSRWSPVRSPNTHWSRWQPK